MSNRGLLLGTGLGGALLLLAYSRRRELERAAVVAEKAAQKAGRAFVEKVKELTGDVTETQRERIRRYNIANLVEKYRGVIPWGVAMAMIEHESNFDPTIYNYWVTETGADGKSKKVLKVGHWTGPGTRIGGGANGLFQIMSQYISADGKKGYKAPSVESLFDPETNIRAALEVRNREWPKLLALGVPAPFMPIAIYMAHAEGLGGAEKILGWAKSNGGITWGVVVKYPGKVFNRLAGMAVTGARALLWEKHKDEFLGVGGANA